MCPAVPTASHGCPAPKKAPVPFCSGNRCFCDAVSIRLLDGFKISRPMFAQRADKILRKLIAFIDISADFADKPFFAFRLRLRLDMVLIIIVGHGFFIAHHAGFGDAANKHPMASEINILLHFQRHKRIDIARKEYLSLIHIFLGVLLRDCYGFYAIFSTASRRASTSLWI